MLLSELTSTLLFWLPGKVEPFRVSSTNEATSAMKTPTELEITMMSLVSFSIAVISCSVESDGLGLGDPVPGSGSALGLRLGDPVPGSGSALGLRLGPGDVGSGELGLRVADM